MINNIKNIMVSLIILLFFIINEKSSVYANSINRIDAIFSVNGRIFLDGDIIKYQDNTGVINEIIDPINNSDLCISCDNIINTVFNDSITYSQRVNGEIKYNGIDLNKNIFFHHEGNLTLEDNNKFNGNMYFIGVGLCNDAESEKYLIKNSNESSFQSKIFFIYNNYVLNNDDSYIISNDGIPGTQDTFTIGNNESDYFILSNNVILNLSHYDKLKISSVIYNYGNLKIEAENIILNKNRIQGNTDNYMIFSDGGNLDIGSNITKTIKINNNEILEDNSENHLDIKNYKLKNSIISNIYETKIFSRNVKINKNIISSRKFANLILNGYIMDIGNISTKRIIFDRNKLINTNSNISIDGKEYSIISNNNEKAILNFKSKEILFKSNTVDKSHFSFIYNYDENFVQYLVKEYRTIILNYGTINFEGSEINSKVSFESNNTDYDILMLNDASIKINNFNRFVLENGIASLGKERFAANPEEVFYIESDNPLKTKIIIENNSTLDINKTKVSVNSIEIDSSSKIMFEINETSGGVLEGVGINPKIIIKDGKTLNLIPIISENMRNENFFTYKLMYGFGIFDANGNSNIIINLNNINSLYTIIYDTHEDIFYFMRNSSGDIIKKIDKNLPKLDISNKEFSSINFDTNVNGTVKQLILNFRDNLASRKINKYVQNISDPIIKRKIEKIVKNINPESNRQIEKYMEVFFNNINDTILYSRLDDTINSFTLSKINDNNYFLLSLIDDSYYNPTIKDNKNNNMGLWIKYSINKSEIKDDDDKNKTYISSSLALGYDVLKSKDYVFGIGLIALIGDEKYEKSFATKGISTSIYGSFIFLDNLFIKTTITYGIFSSDIFNKYGNYKYNIDTLTVKTTFGYSDAISKYIIISPEISIKYNLINRHDYTDSIGRRISSSTISKINPEIGINAMVPIEFLKVNLSTKLTFMTKSIAYNGQKQVSIDYYGNTTSVINIKKDDEELLKAQIQLDWRPVNKLEFSLGLDKSFSKSISSYGAYFKLSFNF